MNTLRLAPPRSGLIARGANAALSVVCCRSRSAALAASARGRVARHSRPAIRQTVFHARVTTATIRVSPRTRSDRAREKIFSGVADRRFFFFSRGANFANFAEIDVLRVRKAPCARSRVARPIDRRVAIARSNLSPRAGVSGHEHARDLGWVFIRRRIAGRAAPRRARVRDASRRAMLPGAPVAGGARGAAAAAAPAPPPRAAAAPAGGKKKKKKHPQKKGGEEGGGREVKKKKGGGGGGGGGAAARRAGGAGRGPRPPRPPPRARDRRRGRRTTRTIRRRRSRRTSRETSCSREASAREDGNRCGRA